MCCEQPPDAEQDSPEPQALSEAEPMALWRQAWRLARPRCGRTLSRLRRGRGGFYDADDFSQDLFLEFLGLLGRWQDAPRSSQADLWAAWRRILWQGGSRVVRRAPQRLWSGAELAVDPAELALESGDEEESDGDAGRLSLPEAARAALIQPEDGEETQERLARLEALATALQALPPGQRQLITMLALAGLPAPLVARRLGAGSTNALYQRLRLARLALRRKLQDAER